MTASTAQAETAIKQDFWQSLEDEWQKLSLSKENSWLSDFEEWQPSSRYEFQEVNPLRDHPDALEEGKRRLAEGTFSDKTVWLPFGIRRAIMDVKFLAGDIPSAVLLFEAAVQDHSDQAEAWSLLGMTQAKNENDPAAIAALTKAVELNPHHLGTLMALAVSYTNESYQAQACRTLQGAKNLERRDPLLAHTPFFDFCSQIGSKSILSTGTYILKKIRPCRIEPPPLCRNRCTAIRLRCSLQRRE